MMGFQEAPARLFYDFYLDEHVPSAHMLRASREVRHKESMRMDEAGRYLCQVGVLIEERHFVAVGDPHFALASLTLEARDCHEPSPSFDHRVAAMFTHKSEVHVS
jgi:hypothetical protein